MSRDLLIRNATREDALHIREHLRAADRRELELAERTPDDVVLSFDRSRRARTIEHRGWPVVLLGATPSSTPGVSLVWLLATAELDQIRRDFVLACKPELEQMRVGCDRLVNLTHRSNATVLRWLHWLGFTIDPTPRGPRDEFLLFWLTGVPAPGNRAERRRHTHHCRRR